MSPSDFRYFARLLSLSQQEAAEFFSVSVSTVRRWRSGETSVPAWAAEQLENTFYPREYRKAATELALSQAMAAKIFRVNPRTVRGWISGKVPIPYWVVRALGHMVEFQIEPIEWRRAQDRGIATDTGGRWLHSTTADELAKQGLERDVVNGLWVKQPLGTRAARWDAPAARRKLST